MGIYALTDEERADLRALGTTVALAWRHLTRAQYQQVRAGAIECVAAIVIQAEERNAEEED